MNKNQKKALRDTFAFFGVILGILLYVFIVAELTVKFDSVVPFAVGLTIPIVFAFGFIFYMGRLIDIEIDEDIEKIRRNNEN